MERTQADVRAEFVERHALAEVSVEIVECFRDRGLVVGNRRRPAAHAGAESTGFRRGARFEKAYVLGFRRARAARRTAVDARRGHAVEEAAVLRAIARDDGAHPR